MAEVLACQIVILDGTTISQDVNVSIYSRVTKVHHFRLPITKYAVLLFAEEGCRPSAAKPRVQTPRTR